MSLRKSGFLTPLPPMSHFVIFWFDPPPPHVTHQKVTISDGENLTKNILICVHRMITYGQKGLIKRKSCQRMHEESFLFTHNGIQKKK